MHHTSMKVKTQDGLRLFAQCWEPDVSPLAAICLVHGLGEHSGRYANLAARFIQAGFALMAFDLRGHGKSEGLRGHTSSFEALMVDIDLLLAETRRRYSQLPIFMYGHSLGGILVLNFILRRKPQLSGVVVTSPGLRTAIERQTVKVSLANLVGRIMPTLSLHSGLEVQAISRDATVVQAYLADPLVHDRGTLRMAKETFQAIRWAYAHASEFYLPLLIMHGAADRIAYAEGSQEFARSIHHDCTLKLWDGLYHELHNEPEQAQVFEYLLKWLNEKRIPSISN